MIGADRREVSEVLAIFYALRVKDRGEGDGRDQGENQKKM